MDISFYEYWYKYLYLTTDRVHMKHWTWDKLQQLTCVWRFPPVLRAVNAKCPLCGSSFRWVAFILLFIAEYMIFWWRRPLVSVHSHWWPSGYICSTFIYNIHMYVYKDWHWYKTSVHPNCLEHAIECSSVQWNARACHRMRFFYQNVFSSYSFIVNDVWPARMHSIACSRMRLHSRAFHCMLENSNACSSHVYIH